MNNINYKFKEAVILDDVLKYIDKTYSSHYAKSQKQTTEIVIDKATELVSVWEIS